MRLAGQHTVTINAPADVVWSHVIDWQHWPDWDKGMERVFFKGPINVGSTGKLKLRGGPTVNLKVTQFDPVLPGTAGFEPEPQYTDEFSLFGSRFIFYHRVDPIDANTSTFYVTAHTTGLVALFNPIIRPSFDAKLSEWLGNLKRKIEQ